MPELSGKIGREPHGAKAAEVYGIVGYLLSTAFFLVWVIWAYTPDWVLHSMSITYYPNRYWATAVPIYMLVLICYCVIIYVAKNMINNYSFQSYHTIRDNLEEEPVAEREEAQVFEQTWTIPPAADIPISTINRTLFFQSMAREATSALGIHRD